MENVRNFVIIAHVDHGKSTLADRLLEITGTVDARHMKNQYLDQLELERERGITIKMAPVRMLWHPHRGLTQIGTQMNADRSNCGLTQAETQIDVGKKYDVFLYADLTYAIRGAAFTVWNTLGSGLKEGIYQKALEEELRKRKLSFATQQSVKIEYEGKSVGVFRPDLLVEDKIIVELKAQPFIGETEKKQLWSYLKGSDYKLGLLVNFGPRGVGVERVVYDTARHLRESASNQRESAQVEEYILNLIDTPGHPDFSYEVSRSLAAVEGAVLLVDAMQGIQAQTLSVFEAARKAGLSIIGAVNKVDLPAVDADKSAQDISELTGIPIERVHRVSGKTGEGVLKLLADIVASIPAPRQRKAPAGVSGRAFVFDSFYDDHRGIVAAVRVFEGCLEKGDAAMLAATGEHVKLKEVGYFIPQLKEAASLDEGEIGFIVTGLKDPSKVRIGDSVISLSARSRINADETRMNAENISANLRPNQRQSASWALPGYQHPRPVVFVSFFPDDADDFENLKRSLARLQLNDSSLTFEPDFNEVLGRGFKGGFLGKLHFEITAQRLEREFGVATVVSFPSVAYRVKGAVRARATDSEGFILISNAHDLPDEFDVVLEPMIHIDIITPLAALGAVLELGALFRWENVSTDRFGNRMTIQARMPLAELISDFDDALKSVSQGFASFSYREDGWKTSDLARMDILVAGEIVSGLSRIIPRDKLEREARAMVTRLKKTLPRQQFAQALQARAGGRVVARENIPALRKDVTGYLYGGDRTRKMKLWKKQQRGKKKLARLSHVRIAPEDFKKLLSS